VPSSLRRFIAPALLIATGFVLGRLGDPTPAAVADTRSTPEREAFQSGGARSESILKEMNATLKTIDGRLSRIEAAISKK
jgi:hypothetical protein